MTPYTTTVLKLATDLREQGVSIPAGVGHRGLHMLLHDTPQPDPQRRTPLFDVNAGERLGHVDTSTECPGDTALFRRLRMAETQRLTSEITAILVENAAGNLEQLRPGFDRAAAGVAAAYAAGIRAGRRTDSVFARGGDSISAWRALPAHVQVLDGIAAVRLDMVKVLGIPPRPDSPARQPR